MAKKYPYLESCLKNEQLEAAKELIASHNITELEAINLIYAVAFGIKDGKLSLIDAATKALIKRAK